MGIRRTAGKRKAKNPFAPKEQTVKPDSHMFHGGVVPELLGLAVNNSRGVKRKTVLKPLTPRQGKKFF